MFAKFFAKNFAKFSRSFRKVFEVLASFRRSSEVFGTRLALFGPVRMRWDALGCVRIQFGGLRTFEFVLGFFAAFLDVYGVVELRWIFFEH